jgi:short-subunit dehydrogenase
MDHLEEMSNKMSMDSGDVAEIAIRGMLQGKREIVPGLINQVGILMNRLIPKSVVENVVGSMYRKKEKR